MLKLQIGSTSLTKDYLHEFGETNHVNTGTAISTGGY